MSRLGPNRATLTVALAENVHYSRFATSVKIAQQWRKFIWGIKFDLFRAYISDSEMSCRGIPLQSK